MTKAQPTTPFTDALGTPLSIRDLVVFQHKTAHTFQNRGAPRYVKAQITAFTAKMVTVEWLEVQQLAGYDNTTLTQPPYSQNWNPGLCVRLGPAT